MAEPKRPRLVLHNFLSLDLCKELEFIHKSCSTVGYRPNVFSTTLSHLIATNSAHLIMPFVGIRERLKEKAEEFFGCEYELFVEFTGLISWTRGASIGWHSDDNRPYLKQRDYAAVCYLNSHGKDFKGGIFHFQDGEPAAIVPVTGDIVMYTADNRNIHSVDEISEGERLTLTLWFSRDSSHDEDTKLLSLLSHYSILQEELTSYLPLPASSNMYWFSLEQAYHEQSGFDICLARVHVLGFTFHFSDDKRYYSGLESYSDISELLMKPLKLARGEEIFHKEFVNSLHALQVLQFYCWKASELQAIKVGRESSNVVQVSQSVLEQRNILEAVLMGDPQLPVTVFGCVSYKQDEQPSFDWADVSAAVSVWEDYTRKLCKDLFMCLSYWRTHQSIFSISDIECGT